MSLGSAASSSTPSTPRCQRSVADGRDLSPSAAATARTRRVPRTRHRARSRSGDHRGRARTQRGRDRASFSNYGTCLDIFAPGSQHHARPGTRRNIRDQHASRHVDGHAPRRRGRGAVPRRSRPPRSPCTVATRARRPAPRPSATVDQRRNGSPNLLLYADWRVDDPAADSAPSRQWHSAPTSAVGHDCDHHGREFTDASVVRFNGVSRDASPSARRDASPRRSRRVPRPGLITVRPGGAAHGVASRFTVRRGRPAARAYRGHRQQPRSKSARCHWTSLANNGAAAITAYASPRTPTTRRLKPVTAGPRR